MRADLRVSHAREHRGGDEEGGVERGRAHEDLPADAEQRLHLRAGSAVVKARAAAAARRRTRRPSRPARSPFLPPSRRSPSGSRRRRAPRARGWRRSRRRRSRAAGAGSRRRAGSPGRRGRRARPAARRQRSGNRGARGGPSVRGRRGPARSGAATISHPTSSASPIPSEAQSACAASRAAWSSRPAPDARATTAVVPYVRKLKIVNAPARTVPARPSAAICGRPRWPTIAVSARTYSGSAASAPSAGSARRTISRSCGERRRTGSPTIMAGWSRRASRRASRTAPSGCRRSRLVRTIAGAVSWSRRSACSLWWRHGNLTAIGERLQRRRAGSGWSWRSR